MEAKIKRAIAKLKTVKCCPVCGCEIVRTVDEEYLIGKNSPYKLSARLFYLLQFECDGSLGVFGDGEIIDLQPCDMALFEKATSLNVELAEEDVKAGRATDWEGLCENDDGQCNQAAAM